MSADLWLIDEDKCSDPECCCSTVWHGNLTYNLSPMLREAGWVWPDGKAWSKDNLEGTRAADLGEKLAFVVSNLRRDPEGFKKLNPENGWGTYDGCVEVMSEFLDAVEKWPNARVHTWF